MTDTLREDSEEEDNWHDNFFDEGKFLPDDDRMILSAAEDDSVCDANSVVKKYMPSKEKMLEWLKTSIRAKAESVFLFLLEIILELDKEYFLEESASLVAIAIMYDTKKILRHLMSAGAQRENLNVEGDSDVNLVIKFKRIDLLKMLIEDGNSVNGSNKFGHFPLFLAAAMDIPEAVQMLVEAGADVNQVLNRVKLVHKFEHLQQKFSIAGDTVAHLLLRSTVWSFQSACQTSFDMLLTIVNDKFCKSACNGLGHSLLDELILNHVTDTNVLDKILNSHFSVNLANPYHYACFMKSQEMRVFAFLYNCNFEVDMTCEETPFTALMLTCAMGRFDLTQWLVQHGANLRVTASLKFLIKWVRSARFCFRNELIESEIDNISIMHAAVCGISSYCFQCENVLSILELLVKSGAYGNALCDGTPVLSFLLQLIQAKGSDVYDYGKAFENMLPEVQRMVVLLLQAGARVDDCVHVDRLWNDASCYTPLDYLNRITMMLMEMATSSASVDEVPRSFGGPSFQCTPPLLARPRSLMVLSRKVILEKCQGRHLADVGKCLHMLPVKLQDYVCLKDLMELHCIGS